MKVSFYRILHLVNLNFLYIHVIKIDFYKLQKKYILIFHYEQLNNFNLCYGFSSPYIVLVNTECVNPF